ncbi:pyridoxamine 5'-phosphate oxidase family protein [Priestia megaterium]|jgi:general stress protein 26|uniref:pyridoxamine 5'-phosphate oxidase family protein n=1 Tax=Priestia megaterium TaxID=1404 RepID=UPI0013E3479E|nr:pyridoxamine 5'-phosphate oxidase family protein [Priestia megaterium]MDI3090941.1 pyridoxamine 5'-phosphate oxidase family protein [Priestia megaterium]MED3865320.1 pyridoxamine 5'-phosphate oxidase family protein [Priestia megaterium]MED4102971.1 pyridoxamine 5'-phosphate oxidase family protein [Priestia megaterium]MED4146473.1 pyridoxamine 5'-phosphate oxidase family protein [Priestia megaterium]MED4168776.1 pyridoxamine 5'-phosphate oxidase family protein [Priestia megaterium]
MSNNDVKNQILSVLDDYTIGTLATIQDGKPYSRFMMFFHEDLVLYTATNKDTHKVEELEKNPYVHILLGYDGQGWNDPYVEVEAKVNVETNEELKKKFWNEKLKEWIKSPDDPNYLLLQLTPERMLYFDKAGSKPKEM